MSDEQRNRQEPIPGNLRDVLTDLQMLALRRIEGFGWELRFVRRAGRKVPIPVVSNAAGDSIGVLEEDGRLNLNHGLRIRPPR